MAKFVAASELISRILSPDPKIGVAAIYLGRRSPVASSSLPGDQRIRAASRTALRRFSPAWPCSRRGLPGHPGHPERRWALTPPFHHRLARGQAVCFCGPVRGSPHLGVTQRRALWSPDFPRRKPAPTCADASPQRDRPARSRATVILTRQRHYVKTCMPCVHSRSLRRPLYPVPPAWHSAKRHTHVAKHTERILKFPAFPSELLT